MRFKLTPRFKLLAVLCICLTGEELWLRNAFASNTGRIVFTSLRDGNAEIYVMDADGGNQENLTNHPAYDYHPDWSPDGTKIAFVSRRDGRWTQIYVMEADGMNVMRLTDGTGQKGHPDWSPDGSKIAFSVEDREDYIAVMDADGRNRKTLEVEAKYPSWSPDGGTIAYVSFRDGLGEIYLISVGGRGRERVTHDLEVKLNPSFSPDGRRIAYDAHPEGFGHIYAVGADGRNRVRLTHKKEHHSEAAWSPDGRIIAYNVVGGIWPGDVHSTIHLMAADGRYMRQLSNNRNAIDLQPDISRLGLAVSPASNKSTTWGKLKKLQSYRR